MKGCLSWLPLACVSNDTHPWLRSKIVIGQLIVFPFKMKKLPLTSQWKLMTVFAFSIGRSVLTSAGQHWNAIRLFTFTLCAVNYNWPLQPYCKWSALLTKTVFLGISFARFRLQQTGKSPKIKCVVNTRLKFRRNWKGENSKSACPKTCHSRKNRCKW